MAVRVIALNLQGSHNHGNPYPGTIALDISFFHRVALDFARLQSLKLYKVRFKVVGMRDRGPPDSLQLRPGSSGYLLKPGVHAEHLVYGTIERPDAMGDGDADGGLPEDGVEEGGLLVELLATVLLQHLLHLIRYTSSGERCVQHRLTLSCLGYQHYCAAGILFKGVEQ
jgi:hypothetical protein